MRRRSFHVVAAAAQGGVDIFLRTASDHRLD